MKDLLNCPNCGAPIEKDYCPYCGSVFLDWACFDVGRPTFVKIKDSRGDYRLVKLLVSSVYEKHDYEPVVLYGNNNLYEYVRSHRLTFEAEVASTMKGLYDAYITQGFTPEQAEKFVTIALEKACCKI